MNNSRILELYAHLRDDVDALAFAPPVECVYNPLRYAWNGFTQYNDMYSHGKKRVVFLGMNPGPWGMAQTGFPFGEVEAVKNFLGIRELVITPPAEIHPSYPVMGLDCKRSEVSGKRLWGLFRERFGNAEVFSRENIVLNYCPLLFLTAGTREGTVRNLTPDRLKRDEREKLFALCDECLYQAVNVLAPDYVVGVGNFAAERAEGALMGVNVVRVLHPSPASPQSNTDWGGKVTEQLINSGVWL